MTENQKTRQAICRTAGNLNGLAARLAAIKTSAKAAA